MNAFTASDDEVRVLVHNISENDMWPNPKIDTVRRILDLLRASEFEGKAFQVKRRATFNYKLTLSDPPTGESWPNEVLRLFLQDVGVSEAKVNEALKSVA
jgi:hypothetical protein